MAAHVEHLRRIVDQAPPLTPEQRARLAILLAPGPGPRSSPARSATLAGAA